MASTINPDAVNPNVPVEGAATTSSMRANYAAIKVQLAAAKADIEALESAIEGIEAGATGPAGPTGPTGATGATGPAGADGADGTDTNGLFVNYGSNASTSRPNVEFVVWIGDDDVIPTNAVNGDARLTPVP